MTVKDLLFSSGTDYIPVNDPHYWTSSALRPTLEYFDHSLQSGFHFCVSRRSIKRWVTFNLMPTSTSLAGRCRCFGRWLRSSCVSTRHPQKLSHCHHPCPKVRSKPLSTLREKFSLFSQSTFTSSRTAPSSALTKDSLGWNI